ncbi:MAG: hypothetical protein SOW59_00695 [Corynebacterium sp.]|nr:hypothetical protein [Corynebacterium sp.]
MAKTSDTFPQRAEELPRKGVFLAWWIGGVIVISLAVVMLAVVTLGFPRYSSGRTVSETMTELQTHAGVGEQTGEASASGGTRPGYRIVELADALGLPDGSFPQDVLDLDVGNGDTRRYFVSMISKAVESGDITSEEADAVIKAFDKGLVDMPVHLLESATAHGTIADAEY